MRSFILASAIAALVVGPGSAHAQRADELPRGAKVRFATSDGSRRLGYVDSVTTEAVAVRLVAGSSIGQTVQLPRDLVTSMEVSKRTPGRGVLKGGLLGLLIGGGTGFILGAATYTDEDYCFIVCSAAEAGAFVGALGGIVGLPVGMFVGGMTSRAWRPVDLTRR